MEELQNRSISPQADKDGAACRIGSLGANKQTSKPVKLAPVNLERPRVLSRPSTKIVPSSFFKHTFIANLAKSLFVPLPGAATGRGLAPTVTLRIFPPPPLLFVLLLSLH